MTDTGKGTTIQRAAKTQLTQVKRTPSRTDTSRENPRRYDCAWYRNSRQLAPGLCGGAVHAACPVACQTSVFQACFLGELVPEGVVKAFWSVNGVLRLYSVSGVFRPLLEAEASRNDAIQKNNEKVQIYIEKS